MDRSRRTRRRPWRPARTGLFKRAAAKAAGNAWHICDTTSCQVYNGYTGETSPEAKAATATAGQYLTYGGDPIFAEFSSANGGWSSDGGKPYLVAKADPYDGVVTGTANWGHAWTKDVVRRDDPGGVPDAGDPAAHRRDRPRGPRRVGRSGHLRAPRGVQGGRDGERDVAALGPRAEERVVPRRSRSRRLRLRSSCRRSRRRRPAPRRARFDRWPSRPRTAPPSSRGQHRATRAAAP